MKESLPPLSQKLPDERKKKKEGASQLGCRKDRSFLQHGFSFSQKPVHEGVIA
jgi:hypothetical protein